MGEPLPTPYYHREAPVCGINGVTYKSKEHCPVRVAYEGQCRHVDTHWYQPHGWLLYRP